MAKKNRGGARKTQKSDSFFKIRERLFYLQRSLRDLNYYIGKISDSRGKNSNVLNRFKKGLEYNTKERKTPLKQLVEKIVERLSDEKRIDSPVHILEFTTSKKDNTLHIYLGDSFKKSHGHIVVDMGPPEMTITYVRKITGSHGQHNRCNIKLAKPFGYH